MTLSVAAISSLAPVFVVALTGVDQSQLPGEVPLAEVSLSCYRNRSMHLKFAQNSLGGLVTNVHQVPA